MIRFFKKNENIKKEFRRFLCSKFIEQMISEITPKNAKHFNCEKCDFICSKQSDWNRHSITRKHFYRTKLTILEQKNAPIDKFTCKLCYKSYKVRNSLWYHEQKCKSINILDSSISDSSNNIIELLINENKDFKNIIMELVKNKNEISQKVQPINTIINSNNKTFNLQFFLNEECKDALNMSDFINSIELKLSDLENIEKLGYVEGMSNIIINQLKDTDMYKRPLHCSDAKRETLYIKEENKWEKEDSENKKMLKAVRDVDKKNYKMLNTWKEKFPKCMDGESKQCDDYMKLMSKVMDGDKENVNKVIKKVAKEVVIDKL
jgi:hypothetical protein